MVRLFLVIGSLFILSNSFLFAPDQSPLPPAPRIGFEETFAAADGWNVTNGAPLKSIDLKKLPAAPAPQLPAGTPVPNILFTTVCGALNKDMRRDDWPEWPKQPFDSHTSIQKKYDAKVNLDVYRYLVIDMPIRGCNVVLAVNGVALPIAYTTGLRVYDLNIREHASLKGFQKITLAMEFLNTSGSVGFNSLRLVASLTPEERKVLMPVPVEYKKETLVAHPYHRLEALNRRAGRARHAEYEGQLCVYRDTLSGATVWKLTDQPGDQHFRASDSTLGWSADGRFFQVNGGKNGKNVFDFQTGQWLKTALVGEAAQPLPDYAARWDSKKHPGRIYGYKVDHSRAPDKIFRFYAFDSATGQETEIAQWKTQAKWAVRELATSPTTDKAVIGLRESTECSVIDPDHTDPAQRVQPITLSTRLKGLHFGKQDTTLIWHNCYTYEQWERVVVPTHPNEKIGDTHLAYYTGGGHAGSGGGFNLNHYEGLTLIRPSDLTEWMAGDQVKIFAYYRQPFECDYGALTADGRWWVVNGTGGDVANQILMVDGHDCASISRLAGMNTSRNDWSTNTYTLASSNGQRVAWVSDQLGDGDVHFVDTPQPPQPGKFPPLTPPKNPKGEFLPHGVLKLTWEKSESTHATRTEIYAFPAKLFPPKRPLPAGDNDSVIGAVLPQQPQQFFDWGGEAPGETVTYHLIAVDARGNRSAPAALAVTWPALAKLVTLEIQTVDLPQNPDIEIIERAGEKMAAADLNAPRNEAHPARLNIPFTLPVAGDYAIWVRYAPGYTTKLDIAVTLDQTKGRWRLRCPYRPMSGTLAKPKDGKAKIFSDRLWLNDANEFTLAAGDHLLTLELDEKLPSNECHAIQTVWIANDPSFRPPGFNPRADFEK